MVLIPSWEQPVVGNLSDELGAFWELVIGSDASAGSLGIGWELGSQKISLGGWEPKKREPKNCRHSSRMPVALITRRKPRGGKTVDTDGEVSTVPVNPLSRLLEPVVLEPVTFHA